MFSTHVVEDLAATCNQLAIMHKGSFLYAGSMKDLAEEARGKIWICKVPDEEKARKVEEQYRITSKQYTEGGLQAKSDFRSTARNRMYICSGNIGRCVYLCDESKRIERKLVVPSLIGNENFIED